MTHRGDVAVAPAMGRQPTYGNHVGHFSVVHLLDMENHTCPCQALLVTRFPVSGVAGPLRTDSIRLHGVKPQWIRLRCVTRPCTRRVLP